jgi:hypothetical protein
MITELQYVNEHCPYCHAEWGHFGHCPILNHNSAQAHFAVNGASYEDNIMAHAFGITLTGEQL